MLFVEILFYVFAAVLVVAALGVITARNPVHSALFLVLCFFTSAAIWLLLEAEFLAIVLVLVYVGAVMVLFLFVVMMLDINLEELRKGFTRYARLGWLIGPGRDRRRSRRRSGRSALGIDVSRGAAPMPADYSNTRALGAVLYTSMSIPSRSRR